MKKRCKDCGELKNIGWFYQDKRMADGYLNTCKTCKRRQVAENRELKIEYYRKREAERAQRPENVAARQAYAKTPAGRASHLRANRLYRRFKALEARA